MTCLAISAHSNTKPRIRRGGLPNATPENSAHGNVTGLLAAWQAGDEEALGRLTPQVYQQLKRLAGGHLKSERKGHTLQPTALVHEAFVRLVDQKQVRWKSRAHFFGIASHLMRRILVDYARRRNAEKRQAAAVAISLDEAAEVPAREDIDMIRLDDALDDLAELDPRQSRIVELRFFGGLTVRETAHVLGISPATVKLDWAMARAWLFDQLKKG